MGKGIRVVLPIIFDCIGCGILIVMMQYPRFHCTNICRIDHIGRWADSGTIQETTSYSVKSAYGDQLNAQHWMTPVGSVVDGADCVVDESRWRLGAVEEIGMNIKAHFRRRRSDRIELCAATAVKAEQDRFRFVLFYSCRELRAPGIMQNVVLRSHLIFLCLAHDLVKDNPIDEEIATAANCSERLFQFGAN